MKKANKDEWADNTERNDKSLKAWCQWKEICSILGCRPEAKSLLAQEVGDAFRKKLNYTVGPRAYGHLNGVSCNEDFAQEFDVGIIEKAYIAKTRKNYKDVVWQCIAVSDDPPLKVIRGKLIGNSGVINGIVEKWLRGQGWESSSVTDKKTGKRADIWVHPEALPELDFNQGAAPQNDDGENDVRGELRKYDDGVYSESEEGTSPYSKYIDDVSVDGDDPVDVYMADVADAAILLAKFSGISITTDKYFLDFVGRGPNGIAKSAVSKRFANFKKKYFAPLADKNWDDRESCLQVVTALLRSAEELIEKTPGGSEFLLYAEKCREADDDKRSSGLSRPMPGFDGLNFYAGYNNVVEKR